MSSSTRILLIMKYLWETTDDSHAATIADIIAFLAEHGIRVKDYRVIQKDIEEMGKMGLDIVTRRTRQYEYSIGLRHFDIPEIKLLIDAVQSSRFISASKSRALIRKLSTFVGPHQAKLLKRQLYVDQRSKSANESILHTIDTIQDAIADGRKVSFQYFDYSPAKKKVARRDGQPYVLSPYSLVWGNDNYYLVGRSEYSSKILKYRIDRIENLVMLEEPRIKPPKEYSVREFFTQEFTMMSGKPCEVELLAHRVMMNNIIDHFGATVETEIVDEQFVKVTTTTDLSATFYGWIFASEGGIRILGPQEAVDGFQTIVNKYASKA